MCNLKFKSLCICLSVFLSLSTCPFIGIISKGSMLSNDSGKKPVAEFCLQFVTLPAALLFYIIVIAIVIPATRNTNEDNSIGSR